MSINWCICDAIEVFAKSPTGSGHRNVGGDEAYQARYRQLAEKVKTKLENLWRAEEIGYREMAGFGSCSEGPGFDIRVNKKLEPDTANYELAVNQAKVAATSLVLVHEAVHMELTKPYLEEEIICRTLQCLYFDDLFDKRGVNYDSTITGRKHQARLEPETPFLLELLDEYLTRRMPAYKSGKTVDLILGDANYRRQLVEELSDQNFDFVRRSLDWWGGLTNREILTRGSYLKFLARDFPPNHRTGEAIVRILESFQNAGEWQQAKKWTGVVSTIRDALQPAVERYRTRLQKVQRTLGEDLLGLAAVGATAS